MRFKSKEAIDAVFRAKITRPLGFGDVEQIKVLNAWRSEIDLFDEEHALIDPKMPVVKWRVEFSWREESEEIVEARTQKEAEEIIKEDYGDREDFEIDGCWLVKDKKST